MSICPNCKYEYREVYDVEVVQRTIKRGKDKGKVVSEEHPKLTFVGDEKFTTYGFVTAIDNYGIDREWFECCPKCGTLFKEV